MNDATRPVLVLTALNLEFRAVREHLTGPVRTWQHQAGTVFTEAFLKGTHVPVVLAVAGEGNHASAILAERANARYQPSALLFAGVAGGLKDDLRLGDVVVATRVYAYHGGSESDDGFRARPRAFEAPHRLEQVARHLDLTGAWTAWLPQDQRSSPPAVHFRPIAAGEVLLNSRDSPLARQLRGSYNDAVAIEMESAGVAHAGHLGSLPVLTIRGISDLADGNKDAADADGSQLAAAANAAAFAAALIAALHSQQDGGAGDSPHGAAALRWQPLSEPAAVTWRRAIEPGRVGLSAAVELHVLPATAAGRLEVRHLQALPAALAMAGREHGVFSASEPVDSFISGEFALASSGSQARQRTLAGLAVGRSGQRSCWSALPRDNLGALLDPTDLSARLAGWLDFLTSPALMAPGLHVPELIALAVGIDPAEMLTEGHVSDLPRRSAQFGTIRAEPLRVTPDDMIALGQARAASAEVAEELTARLLHAFRGR